MRPGEGLGATPEWHRRAKCTGLDPEMFFPALRDVAAIEVAKAFCSDCPVKRECLATALAVPEQDGIFGGLTPEERGVHCRPPTDRPRGRPRMRPHRLRIT